MAKSKREQLVDKLKEMWPEATRADLRRKLDELVERTYDDLMKHLAEQALDQQLPTKKPTLH